MRGDHTIDQAIVDLRLDPELLPWPSLSAEVEDQLLPEVEAVFQNYDRDVSIDGLVIDLGVLPFDGSWQEIKRRFAEALEQQLAASLASLSGTASDPGSLHDVMSHLSPSAEGDDGDRAWRNDAPNIDQLLVDLQKRLRESETKIVANGDTEANDDLKQLLAKLTVYAPARLSRILELHGILHQAPTATTKPAPDSDRRPEPNVADQDITAAETDGERGPSTRVESGPDADLWIERISNGRWDAGFLAQRFDTSELEGLVVTLLTGLAAAGEPPSATALADLETPVARAIVTRLRTTENPRQFLARIAVAVAKRAVIDFERIGDALVAPMDRRPEVDEIGSADIVDEGTAAHGASREGALAPPSETGSDVVRWIEQVHHGYWDADSLVRHLRIPQLDRLVATLLLGSAAPRAGPSNTQPPAFAATISRLDTPLARAIGSRHRAMENDAGFLARIAVALATGETIDLEVIERETAHPEMALDGRKEVPERAESDKGPAQGAPPRSPDRSHAYRIAWLLESEPMPPAAIAMLLDRSVMAEVTLVKELLGRDESAATVPGPVTPKTGYHLSSDEFATKSVDVDLSSCGDAVRQSAEPLSRYLRDGVLLPLRNLEWHLRQVMINQPDALVPMLRELLARRQGGTCDPAEDSQSSRRAPRWAVDETAVLRFAAILPDPALRHVAMGLAGVRSRLALALFDLIGDLIIAQNHPQDAQMSLARRWTKLLAHLIRAGDNFDPQALVRDLASQVTSPIDKVAQTLLTLSNKAALSADDRAEIALAAEALGAQLDSGTRRSIGDPLPSHLEDLAADPENTLVGEQSTTVECAGLVLASPFLPRLFSLLDLVENQKMINPAAADRGTRALRHLAFGDIDAGTETAAENADLLYVRPLPLARLLCGIEENFAEGASEPLTNTEKSIIDGLIASMIERWQTIGNTSPAGLREAFLQRPGKLQLSDGQWRLTVEPRAFDMLLDSLPWSFSIVKHGWMRRPLHVNWR